MQIDHQIIKLLFGQGGGGHHLASVQNGCFHKLIISKKTAGQVFLLEEPLHAGTFAAAVGIGAMALGAVHAINAPPLGLLRVQSQFGIGLLIEIFAAAGQYGQKNCACQDGRSE